MLSRRFLLVCLIVAGTMVSGGVVASDGFSIETENTVSIPERTIDSPEGDATFAVSEVKVIAPRDTITVDAAAPDGTSYFLFFRNDQGDVIIRTDRLDSPQEVTLNTSAEPAGSYVLTVGPDSTPKDIIPVVIEAYQVTSIETDNETEGEITTTAGRSTNVSVKLTQTANRPIEDVNLTVWSEREGIIEAVSLTADQSADNKYHYEGSLPKLDRGEYNVQVRVQGGDQVNGQFALIGLSSTRTLTVTESEGTNSDGKNSQNDDTSGTDENTSDSESADDNTDTATGEGEKQSAGETDTTNKNGTQSEADHTTNGTKANGTAGGTGTDSNGTDESKKTTGETETNGSSDGVINPNSPNADPNTNNSVPLNAVPSLLVIMLLVASIKRIRGR